MKHLTHETKKRRSFCLNLSSVQTPVPNTADLALLGMTVSTNPQCRFLASKTTLQSQTSYFSQSSMRNTHTEGANPAQIQLFWSRRYMWHELYQHKLIFLCSKQRYVCCWDWPGGWTAVLYLYKHTFTHETCEHLKISTSTLCTGSFRPQMCVCCKRDTTWRTVSDLSWHRCSFFTIFILLTPL